MRNVELPLVYLLVAHENCLARIFAAMLRVGDETLRVLMVVQPRVRREHAGLALGEVHAHRLIVMAGVTCGRLLFLDRNDRSLQLLLLLVQGLLGLSLSLDDCLFRLKLLLEPRR